MGEIAIIDAVAALPQTPGAGRSQAPGGAKFAGSLEAALEAAESGVSAQDAFGTKELTGLIPAQLEALKAVALENIAAANIPDDVLQALLTGVAGLENAPEATEPNDAGDNVQTAAELLQWLQALVAGMALSGAPVGQEAEAVVDAAVSTAPVQVSAEAPEAPVGSPFMGTPSAESIPADDTDADLTAPQTSGRVPQAAPVPTETGPAGQPQDVPAPAEATPSGQTGEDTPAAQTPALVPDAAPASVVEDLGARPDAPEDNTPQAPEIQVTQTQATEQAPGPEQAAAPDPTGAVTAASAAGQAPAGPDDAKRVEARGTSLERPLDVQAIASEAPQAGQIESAGIERTTGTLADQERLIERVSSALQQAAANGRTTVRVRLYPPELGTVRIQVSMFRGSVTARIETSTAEAHHILGANLGGLRESIREAGVDLGGLEVNHREASMQFGLGQQGRDRNGYQAPGRPDTTRREPPVEAVEALRESELAAPAGMLDVLV
ncbi:MAG: flagellar hook-length control protein FliK [Planctomycetes bacterium]|nr:flagellar hook-length control protein FliK [Planctomycetota bacterium]